MTPCACKLYVYTILCVLIYVRMHTYVHAYVHTYIHTYVHTYLHMHTYKPESIIYNSDFLKYYACSSMLALCSNLQSIDNSTFQVMNALLEYIIFDCFIRVYQSLQSFVNILC